MAVFRASQVSGAISPSRCRIDRRCRHRYRRRLPVCINAAKHPAITVGIRHRRHHLVTPKRADVAGYGVGNPCGRPPHTATRQATPPAKYVAKPLRPDLYCADADITDKIGTAPASAHRAGRLIVTDSSYLRYVGSFWQNWQNLCTAAFAAFQPVFAGATGMHFFA